MTHPHVEQLFFTRSEFLRALVGIPPDDAVKRIQPMNSISWIVGHIANQEHSYWIRIAQEREIYPDLRNQFGFGSPASTPDYDEVLGIWNEVTEISKPFLETLDSALLSTHFLYGGRSLKENIGTMLQRMIYHYWYHMGEILSVRQVLGHRNLPDFVGNLGLQAPYRPDTIT